MNETFELQKDGIREVDLLQPLQISDLFLQKKAAHLDKRGRFLAPFLDKGGEKERFSMRIPPFNVMSVEGGTQ